MLPRFQLPPGHGFAKALPFLFLQVRVIRPGRHDVKTAVLDLSFRRMIHEMGNQVILAPFRPEGTHQKGFFLIKGGRAHQRFLVNPEVGHLVQMDKVCLHPLKR